MRNILELKRATYERNYLTENLLRGDFGREEGVVMLRDKVRMDISGLELGVPRQVDEELNVSF